MASEVPYKFFKTTTNGYTSVDMGAYPNTPYGYQEIGYDEFKKLAQRKGYYSGDGTTFVGMTKPADYGTYGSHYVSYGVDGQPTQFDQIMANPQNAAAFKQIEAGQPANSDYIIDDNGTFTSKSSQAQQALYDQGVANGTLKKIPIGNGFGYIPTGSPADYQNQGMSYEDQLKQPSVQAFIANNNLNPISPSGNPSTPTSTSTGSVSSPSSPTQSAPGQATPGQFVNYTQVPGNPQIYGTTSSGQVVAFESWAQLLASNNGQAPQINQIAQPPTSAVNYSQYSQTGNTSTGSGTGQNFTPTGDPKYDALLQQMQTYLDTLQKNGQVINPNVTITPDQLAAFAKQASDQIHPFFATQLQAATDQYLSTLGYNVQQLNNQVAQAQTTYGRNLDTLASNSADQGFAQSGIRQKQEGQLASDTQFNLDQNRSALLNSAGNSARQFATTYGGTQVPNAPQIGAQPRVLPGQSQFDTSGNNSGLYTLDPSIYNKLIGTEQNSEKSATDTLSSQLASNAQQLASNQQSRTLNLT